MSTKTVDILELAELMHCDKQTILNNRKTHPLYRKGFKNGGGRSSTLLWFQDHVDAYLESIREEIEAKESQLGLAREQKAKVDVVENEPSPSDANQMASFMLPIADIDLTAHPPNRLQPHGVHT